MNVDRLIEQIRTEVVRLTQGASAHDDVYRQQTAVSLIARVPVMQSSAIYSSLKADGIAPRKVDAALDLGAGICGHHVDLALNVTRALDVPCRQVQIFYTEDQANRNHTFVEIEWGEQWRMVDLTWGFIPHRGSLDTALSYAESLERNHRTGLHHSCIPWRLVVENTDDIFGYLTTEPDAILYDGGGVIRVSPALDGDSATYALPHQIYEVGRGKYGFAETMERRLAVEVPPGRWQLTVRGSTSGPGILSVDQATVALESGDVAFYVDASGPRRIHLTHDSAAELGHLEITSIEGIKSAVDPMTDRASADGRSAIRLL